MSYSITCNWDQKSKFFDLINSLKLLVVFSVHLLVILAVYVYLSVCLVSRAPLIISINLLSGLPVQILQSQSFDSLTA